MQNQALPSLIEFHRKRAGLTQMELAKHARVSRSVIQDVESGNLRTSWSKVMQILKVLNVKIEFGGPLVGVWKEQEERGTR